MGSNIVRLTDRKYMLTLIRKIREEHENQQAARIQERKVRNPMGGKTGDRGGKTERARETKGFSVRRTFFR
jgi:IS30 family transposase